MEEIKQLPRCYSFSFDIETVTLFFKIQKWIISKMREFLSEESGQTRMMEYFYKEYGGDKSMFINFGQKEKPFGFEDSILWDSETEDEIVYGYTFSPIEIQTEEVCERCKGKKYDFLGNDCHECNKTGKKYIPSERHFSKAMLSLWPVMRLANWALLEQNIEKSKRTWIPETNKKQIVAVEWTDTTGMYSCSIQAWVDDSVLGWIKSAPNSDAKLITDAMQKIEEVLLSRQMKEYDFRFNLYGEGRFGLSVPGDACDLSICNPSCIGMFGNIGKTLQPHNVDNRFQQIEFIVGLAVLNDLVEPLIL